MSASQSASCRQEVPRFVMGGPAPAPVPTDELDGPDGRRLVVSVQDLSTLRDLQQQLGHAQRMEAVGRLTGGVAHDFNNLLTVICGNLDLLKTRMSDDGKAQRFLELARRSAENGRDLTRQLLAYSREQLLEPSETDVNDAIRHVHDMMLRTVPEDVNIEINLEPDAWRAWLDRGKLENAILNLVINARDAMPKGGTLTVETTNASDISPPDDDTGNGAGDAAARVPGDYVVISVTDTGEGIPPDVIGNVFDPFFTTKDVGEGNGLGLSMVQGFTTQSGGFVEIDRVPGDGTTISLAFPRMAAPSARLN